MVNIILEGFYFFFKFGDEYKWFGNEFSFRYFRRVCFMFKEFFLFFFVWCLGFLMCKCLIVFL